MQSRLVEQQEQRLLRESTSENDTLLFSPGNLIHQAVAEIGGAHMHEGVLNDLHVRVRLEAQRAAVGVAALQHKLPNTRGKEQAAFLLNHGDALRACARAQRVDGEAVEKNAAGKRAENSGYQLHQSGLAAGVRAENGDDFARARLKTGGFESEERGLRGICGVRIANLLDRETGFRSKARGFRRSARSGRAATGAGAQASLRRRR